MVTEKEIYEIHFCEKDYSKLAIQRALIEYTDDFYIQLHQKDDEILVSLQSKEKTWNMKKIEKELFNQTLEEEVRIKIEEETKTIREQLFKSAIN